MGTETKIEPLLTPAQLCSELNISRGMLYRWHDLGLPSLPVSKCGRSRRYRLSSVMAWLDAREIAKMPPEAEAARRRRAGRPKRGQKAAGGGRWDG